MATAISITQIIQGEQGTYVAFNVVLSGSYVAGGDTLDFTKATQDASFQGVFPLIVSSLGPLQLDVWFQGGAVDTLLDYQLVPVLGSALNNCKLVIGAEDSFGTEFTAGAYSSDLTAAATKISGSLIIPRNL